MVDYGEKDPFYHSVLEAAAEAALPGSKRAAVLAVVSESLHRQQAYFLRTQASVYPS